MRGSSSVYIAKKLRKEGFNLNLHDFVATREDMENLALGDVYDDIYDACEDASVLLILNNHKRYFDLQEHQSIMSSKNGGFVILDAWGVCQNLNYNENINVKSLGDMMI